MSTAVKSGKNLEEVREIARACTLLQSPVSELSAPDYLMMDKSTKMNNARLNQGELVTVHPTKIAFPKAPFKG